ncbi:MAG: chemotaxis protein CheX [Romboutsia sp.]|nr:chemotaxis protein CheX [Romboutsia sp.]
MQKINKNLIIDRYNESINEVMTMFLMRDIKIGQHEDIAEISLVGDKVIINISIVGELVGSITINLDIDTAKKIASIMTMEENIEFINDMHESALKEMLNMITGTFISKLSQIENPITNKGYNLDISSPNSSICEDNIIIKSDYSNFIKSISYDIKEIGTFKSYLSIQGI